MATNSIWTIDPTTCRLSDLRKLFITTSRRLAKTKRPNHAAMELHVILNWYRSRLGEPSTVFDNKDSQ